MIIADLFLLLILKTFQQALRILPERVQAATGSSLGRLASLLMSERRGVALSNLARVFPDLDEKARKAIAKRCFENMGINFIESLVLPYIPKEAYPDRFTVENGAVMEEALGLNKGVLVLAFHYANWEIMGVITHLLGRDIVVLARPLKRHSRLNAFMNRLRTATGLVIIPNAGTGRHVMRQLRENRIVALLADQREKSSAGVQVEFFGEMVSTGRGIATIGMKTGAPVVPIYTVREGFLRYRFILAPSIEMERNGKVEDLVYRNTKKINEFLESIILARPEEWFWVHRRWGSARKRKGGGRGITAGTFLRRQRRER